MQKSYFETIKERWIESAKCVNAASKENNVEVNHTELGLCWAWTQVLKDMGHDASVIRVKRPQNGCSVLPRLCLNDEDINLLSIMEQW